MKPIKGWVVIGKDGEFIDGTFKLEEDWSIQTICENLRDSWSEISKHGYRCIRVTLTQDKGE